MSRSLPAALVTAVAAMTPAAAWAQDGPTLAFDKPCYAKGDPMEYSGSGYAPGDVVPFRFTSRSNQATGTFETEADAAGAIEGVVTAPSEDDVLADNHISALMDATAGDGAQTAFRLTRWDVEVDRGNGRAPNARKPMRVTAYGFTRAIGEPLYVQYRRGGRLRRAVRLGRLGGECGDLTRTVPRGLPRGLRPGRYTLMFTTSPRATNGERVWFKQTLR